jgi:hypothetical protein
MRIWNEVERPLGDDFGFLFYNKRCPSNYLFLLTIRP